MIRARDDNQSAIYRNSVRQSHDPQWGGPKHCRENRIYDLPRRSNFFSSMTWMPLAPLTTYVTRSRRRGACHTLGDAPFHSIGKRFIRDMSTRAFGHLLT